MADDAPAAAAPPPASKTQDTFTHHTSPVSGPQVAPSSQQPAAPSRNRIKSLPDQPLYITKHSNPVGRPKTRNNA
jgi:hypothetical protein